MRRLVFDKWKFILLLLIIAQSALAQNLSVSVSGTVTDMDSGLPLLNQEVFVEITASGSVQQFDLLTGPDGIFSMDSIITSGAGTALVRVYDCNNEPHEQTGNFAPAQTSLYFDFLICSDSIDDCQANFTWGNMPGNDFSFVFMDLSAGNPDEWFWDFGDGSTSTEQNPVHLYNTPGIYQVCLEITNSTTNCTDTLCQDITVDTLSSDCQNWFEYSTEDNLTYSFTGYAVPEAQVWIWDFGDGNTAYGQIATHTYDTGIPGIFNVTLTTLHLAPTGGDSCTATSVQPVMAGNLCSAMFESVQVPGDQFTFHFADLSSGNPGEWLWDFGDGSTSIEQNPVHTFLAPGNYFVCLTITTDSLGFICTDTYCDSIEVNYNLQAAFSASLDTVSGNPNTYYFEDLSTGEPDSWLWEFGDGTISTDQNPVHQYQESGSYDVCLTVSRTFTNQVYQDDTCAGHQTPAYYDFGGTVFLGENPMNNLNGDTSIVDVALAYLYRRYDDKLVPADTTMFHQYGFYYFTNVREGDYLVRIELMESAEHYGQFLPGYHLHSHTWTAAHSVQLQEENIYTMNVHLDPLEGLLPGPGSISGHIEFTGSDIVAGEQKSGVEIMIMDQNMEPLSYQKTDTYGTFSFPDIALGTYYLHAEAAGFYTVTEMVVLDEENTLANNVQLKLHEQLLSVEKQNTGEFLLGNVYPNPAGEMISMSLTSAFKDQLRITVRDISGTKHFDQLFRAIPGEQVIRVNVSGFPHGFYLVRIDSERNQTAVIKKFIK